MPDWIPAKDADFKNFVTHLVDKVGAASADFGLTAAQATDLANAFNAWQSAYANTLSTQALLYTSVLNQDALRKALEAVLRADNALVQANANVADANRAAAGFPIAASPGTRMLMPAPTTAPQVAKVIIMSAAHLVVEFRDQAAPNTKTKPVGVREAEIWTKVGAPPPLDGGECVYLGAASASPYLAVFDLADAGKQCWLCLRWKNARGDPGPWGPVFATMVPGGGGSMKKSHW
ncbi:MAG TPA: hypothetical protein VKX17_04025 [Planctomycetota bacterium]|nr:hypothetical protein [Planctomycetota bacterium]